MVARQSAAMAGDALSLKKDKRMRALGLVWRVFTLAEGREIHVARGEAVHQGARHLLTCWQACERDGCFTVGRDIPSRELARVLGNVALFQPLPPGDFLVRLAGEAMRRRYGRDVAGARLSELTDAARFPVESARWRAVLENAEPFIEEVRVMEDGRLGLCYESVALRVLAADGVTPWVMTGIFFHDWRP